MKSWTTFFVISIILPTVFIFCNENLGMPPSTEQFLPSGTGPYPDRPYIPFVVYYDELESAVPINPETGQPGSIAGINDNRYGAEPIGIGENNELPENPGDMVAIRGDIAGVAGCDYFDANDSSRFRIVELRHYWGGITCRANDPAYSSKLEASANDWYSFNSGVHFINRFKTKGLNFKLEWDSSEAQNAVYTCNRQNGDWEFDYVEEDKDINLDIWVYQLEAENDLVAVCETEGWRRHPEYCAVYPDIFYGPYQNIDYFLRISLYMDETTWRYDEEGQGNIVFNIKYQATLTVE